MGAFQSMLIAILANPDFGESVGYVPGATPNIAQVNLTASVTRDDAPLTTSAKKVDESYHASLKFLGTVDPTYGGVVAPKQGDFFLFPILKGGAVVRWRGASVHPLRGGWQVRCEYRAVHEVAGNRVERT